MEVGRRLTVLIPCAGRGERYGGEKALARVEWRGAVRTMLGHVIHGLPDHNRVVVGVRVEERMRYAAQHFCWTTNIRDSWGQAVTLWQMLQNLRLDETDGPALVLNCDSLLPLHHLRHMAETVVRENLCSVSLVHRLELDDQTARAMSYVDRVPDPTHFVEKPVVPPSRYAMTGAWAFRSMTELRDAIYRAMGEYGSGPAASRGELYLSQAMNYLPSGRHGTEIVERDDVVDWNTPATMALTGARILA